MAPRNKPLIIVVWLRDPDGSRHNQGDSLNALTPGINRPTFAAIKNAEQSAAGHEGAERQALKPKDGCGGVHALAPVGRDGS
jgi:hypothetical protein